MVVSSACMMTARMTHSVTAGRLIGCVFAEASAMFTPRSKKTGYETGKSAGVSGVDIHLHAHADAQRWLAGYIVDADAHRNTLNDLDPVTAGIFRRKQREARGGCRADAVDRPNPSLARIGVDVDRDLLFGLDVGQLGLLWAGLNPDVIGRDDVEGRCRGSEILAGLQRRHVGHDAGEGCSHDGVGK